MAITMRLETRPEAGEIHGPIIATRGREIGTLPERLLRHVAGSANSAHSGEHHREVGQ